MLQRWESLRLIDLRRLSYLVRSSCLSIYLALTDTSWYCFATCNVTVMPRRSDSNDQSTTTENSIQMTFLGKVTPEILAVNNVCFITPKLSNF